MRAIWVALAGALLARLALRVEDGQFEREFSRIYVGVVAVIALVTCACVVGGLRLLVSARA